MRAPVCGAARPSPSSAPATAGCHAPSVKRAKVDGIDGVRFGGALLPAEEQVAARVGERRRGDDASRIRCSARDRRGEIAPDAARKSWRSTSRSPSGCAATKAAVTAPPSVATATSADTTSIPPIPAASSPPAPSAPQPDTVEDRGLQDRRTGGRIPPERRHLAVDDQKLEGAEIGCRRVDRCAAEQRPASRTANSPPGVERLTRIVFSGIGRLDSSPPTGAPDASITIAGACDRPGAVGHPAERRRARQLAPAGPRPWTATWISSASPSPPHPPSPPSPPPLPPPPLLLPPFPLRPIIVEKATKRALSETANANAGRPVEAGRNVAPQPAPASAPRNDRLQAPTGGKRRRHGFGESVLRHRQGVWCRCRGGVAGDARQVGRIERVRSAGARIDEIIAALTEELVVAGPPPNSRSFPEPGLAAEGAEIAKQDVDRRVRLRYRPQCGRRSCRCRARRAAGRCQRRPR